MGIFHLNIRFHVVYFNNEVLCILIPCKQTRQFEWYNFYVLEIIDNKPAYLKLIISYLFQFRANKQVIY